MLTPEDKDLLAKKGISEQQIIEQLACFEKGFPFLKLDAAASIDKGIMAPAESEMKEYLEAWDTYKQGEKTIVKFVPASGAASRMFKNLFEFLGADYEAPKTDFEKKFFDHIHGFAFYNDLNAACLDNTGKNIDALIAEHKEAPHLRTLQKRLAKEVTIMVHSEEDYNAAVEASNILFGNATSEALKKLDEDTLLSVFEGVPQFEVAKTDIEAGIKAVDLFAEKTNIFPSKGEMRKMAQGGGVSLNKEKLTAFDQMITTADLLDEKYLLVQRGKKNYYLIIAK